MSTVIAFPSARAATDRSASVGSRVEVSGPRVVILPVVRIERHAESAAAPPPAAADQAPCPVGRARAERGAGPAGRCG
ncbi:hypothetical protein V5F53_02355 [Xanthobacter sp. V4C-4]|uniref:hypothetical protein n=1 Tax=Xanthobacter cornucopiae TaxID=3119924 RepID=UPI00372BAF14